MNIFDILHTELFVQPIHLKECEGGIDHDSQIKLTWLEKYFLIRVWHIYGFDVVISELTDPLKRKLDISYKHIAHSIKTLEKIGVLSTVNEPKGQGRPIRSFKIDSYRLIDCFGVDSGIQTAIYHEALIGSLLCWGRRNNEVCFHVGQGSYTPSHHNYLKDEHHKLDHKSRFFIATLLAHADEFGFIESLGRADIKALSGFGSDQQRRLVIKMKKLGYIRSVIHGFTNPKIFGRVQTVYCLNTHSADISGLEPIAFTIFNKTQIDVENEHSESDQLFKTANGIRSKKRIHDDSGVIMARPFLNSFLERVLIKVVKIKVLKGVKDRNFYTYLQYRLESYACWFLSIPDYENKMSEICMQDRKNILRKIRNEVSISSANEKVTDIEKSFANVLYRVAAAMAKIYYQLLNKFNNESLIGSGRVFRILPGKRNMHACIAIANRPSHSGQKLAPCLLIQGHLANEDTIPMDTDSCDESQLDEDLRKRCGFAS